MAQFLTARVNSWTDEFVGVWVPLRWKRYSDRWPTLAGFLEDLRAQGHREVARFLQCLESDLMIRGVAEHLREHCPEIPIVTIHDSIFTTEANVAAVQRVILETWRSIGGKPKLKFG